MPKRGPKSKLVLDLDPDRRAQLDRAIVEGRETKAVLHQRFAKPHGIGYRAFCNYAAQLETLAQKHYLADLIAEAFGNHPNTDLQHLIRAITFAVLNDVAADLSADKNVSPNQLYELLKACRLLQRITVAPRPETEPRP